MNETKIYFTSGHKSSVVIKFMLITFTTKEVVPFFSVLDWKMIGSNKLF